MMRTARTGFALAASLALLGACQATGSDAPAAEIAVDLTLDKTP